MLRIFHTPEPTSPSPNATVHVPCLAGDLWLSPAGQPETYFAWGPYLLKLVVSLLLAAFFVSLSVGACILAHQFRLTMGCLTMTDPVVAGQSPTPSPSPSPSVETCHWAFSMAANSFNGLAVVIIDFVWTMAVAVRLTRWENHQMDRYLYMPPLGPGKASQYVWGWRGGQWGEGRGVLPIAAVYGSPGRPDI